MKKAPCTKDFTQFSDTRRDYSKFSDTRRDYSTYSPFTKDYTEMCGVGPFIIPSGNVFWSKDQDDNLYASDKDGADITSAAYAGGASTVDARGVAVDPSSKVAIYTSARSVRLFSFDGANLTEDWNVGLNSDHERAPYGMWFDKDGNFFVGFKVSNASAIPLFPVKKFSRADGSLIWEEDFGFADGRNLKANIGLGGGNILYCWLHRNFGGLIHSTIRRIDPSNGSTLNSIAMGDDRPAGYTVVGTPDGGLIVASGNKSAENNIDGMTYFPGNTIRKYDSSLNLIWTISEPSITNIRHLCVDSDNNFYVGGNAGTSTDGRVAKYSPGDASNDPVRQWLDSVPPSDGEPWKMGCDGDGFLLVGTRAGTLIKYDLDGNEIWSIVKDGTTNNRIHGADIHPGNPALFDDYDLSLIS